ncbi:MAG: hypothetical protein OXC02_03295, partial [Rhodobacteraceae bacterium]|nr:hypothetical protein [Paracoccaceae bacterium]
EHCFNQRLKNTAGGSVFVVLANAMVTLNLAGVVRLSSINREQKIPSEYGHGVQLSSTLPKGKMCRKGIQ